MTNRVLLCIMDGFGESNGCSKDAVKTAATPNIDNLLKTVSNTEINASGEYVGLPDGQMGNSEVGLLFLGAGRVVYQELTKINTSIKDGSFFENDVLTEAVDHAKKNNSSLHLMGLVSDGGVHSSIDHLLALIDLAAKSKLKKVYVHAFLDGRDTPPQSAIKYLEIVENRLKERNLPRIASVMGRYYVMDRDNRWDRVKKAYECLVSGYGKKAANAVEAVEKSYSAGETDEFVLPYVTGDEKSRICDNDAVIFFNFRPDRAREITKALTFENFTGFDRDEVRENLYYATFTQYDETFLVPVAFPPHAIENTLGKVLDAHEIKQFRTAETEKYAHVTFFFNGGEELPGRYETRVLVNSPKVKTYDLQPEMSAPEVCEKVLDAIDNEDYGFILVNFANPDMVGHTGVFDAAVKACETVDECVGRIVEAVKKTDIKMLLTADHGNAECMEDDKTHKPFTAHTTNPVPLFLINDNHGLKDGGALCDVAPTVLDLMGIEKPAEMTGHSLLK